MINNSNTRVIPNLENRAFNLINGNKTIFWRPLLQSNVEDDVDPLEYLESYSETNGIWTFNLKASTGYPASTVRNVDNRAKLYFPHLDNPASYVGKLLLVRISEYTLVSRNFWEVAIEVGLQNTSITNSSVSAGIGERTLSGDSTPAGIVTNGNTWARDTVTGDTMVVGFLFYPSEDGTKTAVARSNIGAVSRGGTVNNEGDTVKLTLQVYSGTGLATNDEAEFSFRAEYAIIDL